MAKRVVVSSAQKSAARAMVRRSEVTGRLISASVVKIANAKALPSTRGKALAVASDRHHGTS